MRTLVLGGIRSGKSEIAEQLVSQHDSVRYVATAVQTAGLDPQFRERVTRHRDRRPAGWTTVESIDLPEVLATPAPATLVDDLGNWVSGQLDAAGGWDDESVDLREKISALTEAVASADGDVVLVSPEVGLTVVAPTAAGRRFQDDLGSVNRAVAAVCDRVLFVVAGKVLDLTDTDITGTDITGTGTGTGEKLRAADPVTPAATDDEHTVAAEEIVAEDIVTAGLTVPVPAAATAVPDVETSAAGDSVHGDLTLESAADFPDVTPPSYERIEAAKARELTLTKPAGSLGRLEDIAVWAAGCQDRASAHPFVDPVVVVFAGDHGVAANGVSAYPPEVTVQMAANIISGGAAVNVLAARAGARVRLEDLAIDADTDPSISRFKVRRSSGDLRNTDSLTEQEAAAAIAAGRAIADEQVDRGADLLIAGDLGIGNTTAAAVIIGTLTSTEPVVVVGRGTGIDDAGWMRKTAAIRDGMWRAKYHRFDPPRLLATVAGADIAAMAGFLAQAAVRRTPVILDGVVVTAAALVADRMAPGARSWWIAGHESHEPAHPIALSWLDLTPVLRLDMRLGEGTGALTALPVVQSALATLESMATFADAGVSTADGTGEIGDSDTEGTDTGAHSDAAAAAR